MDHSEARHKVCVICYNKAKRSLSPIYVKVIQDYVIENYSVENVDFPCGLCDSCRIIVSQYKNGDTKRTLPLVDDYYPGTRILTRGKSVCECRICNVAKSNGIGAKSLKKRKGRPPSEPIPKKVKICPNCFGHIYQGCKHSSSICGSKKQKLENISRNVLTDEKTLQQVSSKVLKDLCVPGCSTVQLSTLGTPLKVSLPPKQAADSSSSHSQLSVEDVISMQSSTGLSDRQLFQVLRDIRLKFGRHSVESNIKATLISRKTVFSDLFVKETVDFVDAKNNKIARPFVFCKNVTEFLDRILLLRGTDGFLNEDKIGFDDGKEVLKLTLSIFDPNNSLPLEPLRVTRSKGITQGHKFSAGGVNKSFILAAAPKTPESYNNCKIFLERTNAKDIQFHFAADLKMINICLGIMSHASLHPCPYCEGTKNVFEVDAPSRTLETIEANFQKWQAESGKKSTLKQYYNCSNEPLLHSNHNMSTSVLSIVPPPSLHIKLGIVNKLYSELLKLFPNLDDWPKSLYITKERYHGETFEGNECNRLLANLDMLSSMLPRNLMPYHSCFLAFRDAMQACFGSSLDPSYSQKILEFENSYKALGISITSKVHIMTRHVPEFLEMHGKPLAQFSEQVVEHCHSKFDRLFNSYRIKDIHHTAYIDQLYRAILHFNSYHI
jgi:G:T-mismatch repair DNA endonuclease (very short patch repair protein)